MLKYEKSTLPKIVRIFIHSNSILFQRLKTYDVVSKYPILPKLAVLLKSFLAFLRKLILCGIIPKFNNIFGKKFLDDVGFFTKSFFRNNRISKLTQHQNPFQRSHLKYVENYAITDANVFQCFTKLIE